MANFDCLSFTFFFLLPLHSSNQRIFVEIYFHEGGGRDRNQNPWRKCLGSGWDQLRVSVYIMTEEAGDINISLTTQGFFPNGNQSNYEHHPIELKFGEHRGICAFQSSKLCCLLFKWLFSANILLYHCYISWLHRHIKLVWLRLHLVEHFTSLVWSFSSQMDAYLLRMQFGTCFVHQGHGVTSILCTHIFI